MPLHVGENHAKGGNRLQVRFFDRGSNLHSVWDTGIITRAQPKEDRWVADLIVIDTAEALAASQKGSVEDGRRDPCWRPGKPTRTPRRASG